MNHFSHHVNKECLLLDTVHATSGVQHIVKLKFLINLADLISQNMPHFEDTELIFCMQALF